MHFNAGRESFPALITHHAVLVRLGALFFGELKWGHWRYSFQTSVPSSHNPISTAPFFGISMHSA